MPKPGKKKIFEFFGTTKPLFIQNALEGADLKRFVDREELLEYFAVTIEMEQNCAVIGEQGTGKSSFLLKLVDMKKDSIYADYLQFSFRLDESEKSRLHFLRKVLRSILYIIMENDELLDLFDAGEIQFEIERLEYSIVIEEYVKKRKGTNSDIEGGIEGPLFKILIPAKFRTKFSAKREKETGKSEKRNYPIHNEDTLFNTIIKLLEKIDDPIVLFIDELDKVGREPLKSPKWDKQVMKILELSREIMLSKQLNFVFSLQNELFEKLRLAETNKGDVSILGLIEAFKKLEGFNLAFAKEAVAASLKYAGYKGTMEDLLEDRLIETVLSAVAGNPRLFMHYLIELSKAAFQEKQPRLTLDLFKKYLFEIDKQLTPERWDTLVSQIPTPVGKST